jgi:hypothetical protein
MLVTTNEEKKEDWFRHALSSLVQAPEMVTKSAPRAIFQDQVTGKLIIERVVRRDHVRRGEAQQVLHLFLPELQQLFQIRIPGDLKKFLHRNLNAFCFVLAQPHFAESSLPKWSNWFVYHWKEFREYNCGSRKTANNLPICCSKQEAETFFSERQFWEKLWLSLSLETIRPHLGLFGNDTSCSKQ